MPGCRWHAGKGDACTRGRFSSALRRLVRRGQRLTGLAGRCTGRTAPWLGDRPTIQPVSLTNTDESSAYTVMCVQNTYETVRIWYDKTFFDTCLTRIFSHILVRVSAVLYLAWAWRSLRAERWSPRWAGWGRSDQESRPSNRRPPCRLWTGSQTAAPLYPPYRE